MTSLRSYFYIHSINSVFFSFVERELHVTNRNSKFMISSWVFQNIEEDFNSLVQRWELPFHFSWEFHAYPTWERDLLCPATFDIFNNWLSPPYVVLWKHLINIFPCLYPRKQPALRYDDDEMMYSNNIFPIRYWFIVICYVDCVDFHDEEFSILVLGRVVLLSFSARCCCVCIFKIYFHQNEIIINYKIGNFLPLRQHYCVLCFIVLVCIRDDISLMLSVDRHENAEYILLWYLSHQHV